MNILSLLKDRLNRDRMASEQGFTLIELLIVIVILGILAAIAVPTYLSFVNSSHTAAAESNVRTAIPAAEEYYQTGQTYASMSGSALRTISPGIPTTVTAWGNGSWYCIQDVETGGTNSTYSYAGGQVPTGTMTGSLQADTLNAGSCTADAGVTASLLT